MRGSCSVAGSSPRANAWTLARRAGSRVRGRGRRPAAQTAPGIGRWRRKIRSWRKTRWLMASHGEERSPGGALQRSCNATRRKSQGAPKSEPRQFAQSSTRSSQTSSSVGSPAVDFRQRQLADLVLGMAGRAADLRLVPAHMRAISRPVRPWRWTSLSMKRPVWSHCPSAQASDERSRRVNSVSRAAGPVETFSSESRVRGRPSSSWPSVPMGSAWNFCLRKWSMSRSSPRCSARR